MKALIVSAQRTGGQFLAACLSNHPDVHCLREEPFKRDAIWQQRLRLGHARLLDFVLSEPFYKVGMCRLTYDQAFNPEIKKYILKSKPHIIHLVRDPLETVTSTLLAKLEILRGILRHDVSGDFVDDEVLGVGAAVVIERVKHLLIQQAHFCEIFGKLNILTLNYADLTDPLMPRALKNATTIKICHFLGLESAYLLWAHNHKMHKRPIESYYSRWPEIKAALEVLWHTQPPQS